MFSLGITLGISGRRQPVRCMPLLGCSLLVVIRLRTDRTLQWVRRCNRPLVSLMLLVRIPPAAIASGSDASKLAPSSKRGAHRRFIAWHQRRTAAALRHGAVEK
jgi:hypothetical protein